MKIIYSYNKRASEGVYWEQEISAASNAEYTFVPFNHGAIFDPANYPTAEALDRLYQTENAGLRRLYEAFEKRVEETAADALIVTNAPPYHPDYLRRVSLYKVLYSVDDPGATYIINIPYLHAYDHVLFVAPTYSREMDLTEKMKYAGKLNADWLPISVFNFEHMAHLREDEVFGGVRDIDIIYIGGFWRQKIPLLAKVRRAFGRRFRVYGRFSVKHNLYIKGWHGYTGWVSPVSLEERVALYQRARIGINIHWNEYGLGNQRLYHLPANGVMQVSDCAEDLYRVFEPDREIVGYCGGDDLIDKLKHYLCNEGERLDIARAGYRRTMREYRFADVTNRAGLLIRKGMKRIGWRGRI